MCVCVLVSHVRLFATPGTVAILGVGVYLRQFWSPKSSHHSLSPRYWPFGLPTLPCLLSLNKCSLHTYTCARVQLSSFFRPACLDWCRGKAMICWAPVICILANFTIAFNPTHPSSHPPFLLVPAEEKRRKRLNQLPGEAAHPTNSHFQRK